MHNLPKNLSNQSKSFQYGSDPVSAKIFVFIMSQICFQQEFVAEYSANWLWFPMVLQNVCYYLPFCTLFESLVFLPYVADKKKEGHIP